MAGGCKSATGCVDARAPVRRASYVSLYKWPESDAEFVRSVAMARRQHQGQQAEMSPSAASSSSSYYGYYYNNGSGGSTRRSGELSAAAAAAAAGYGIGSSPRVVDSYSCRQMYLRSYTFSKKKETVPERTMACLGRVRERSAAVFPAFLPQRGAAPAASDAGESVIGDDRDDDVGRLRDDRNKAAAAGRRSRGGSRRKRRKKKRCAMVRRLQEASCGAVRAIFRRLLACTTSVDVADDAAQPSR